MSSWGRGRRFRLDRDCKGMWEDYVRMWVKMLWICWMDCWLIILRGDWMRSRLWNMSILGRMWDWLRRCQLLSRRFMGGWICLCIRNRLFSNSSRSLNLLFRGKVVVEVGVGRGWLGMRGMKIEECKWIKVFKIINYKIKWKDRKSVV
jgi:hypothetical protein